MHKEYDKYEIQKDVHWQWYAGHSEYSFLVDDSLKAFATAPLGTVIDVGCGDGLPLSLLTGLGFKGYGVDNSYTGIDLAVNRNVSAEFFIEKAEKFAERGLKFDYLYSLNTIEHLDNPAAMLEIMKNIKEFGVIVTDDASFHIDKDPYHSIEFTDESFRELFKEFNLEQLTVRGKYIAYKVWNK